MIYSASSLFLATLVFNAASVWGAPVPVSSDGLPVVRSTGDDILPRMKIVDVVPHQRSVDSEQVDARDTASSSSSIEARDPLPEIEQIVRRFPRKVYQDYYTKRALSPTPDTEPVARSPEVVERRFPRRALYERHEERSNPAPPEARSEQAEPADIQRRYPRKVYADYYQKRESSPPTVVEARQPAPELTDSGRRFPRQVLAERYVKRQDDATAANPPADAPPAAVETPAANPTPVVPTASTSVSASASTATATSPIVPPLDLNRIVKDITSGDLNSFQPGTTIKETTLLINKITHIDNKGSADQNAPVVPPVVPGTPASSSATPTSSSATAATASPTAAGDVPAPESATTPPAAPVNEANPVEGGASRRSLGSVIRRQLGYSGPAWASHLKRSDN